MTAFSRIEESDGGFSAVVEIRSYNSRHLDISLRLGQTWMILEERIREAISKKADRGRIEIRIQIKSESDAVRGFEIDEPLAAAYHSALVQLKDAFKIEGPAPLELLARASGVIKPAEIDPDVEAIWRFLETCVEKAMDGLNEMRAREGQFLLRDFEERIGTIRDGIDKIEAASKDLPRMYQERLTERIAKLTDGNVELDPARIAQEAAFLADKSDISEEIVRVRSHIRQFLDIMNADEPSGRKLNFLLQEFNREFNTIGSKTQIADVSHIVVDIKSELEKMREQVQNVE
jgi:uncharacterized protein (TIGR00255 family)